LDYERHILTWCRGKDAPNGALKYILEIIDGCAADDALVAASIPDAFANDTRSHDELPSVAGERSDPGEEFGSR
jgi:hypothetical protein